MMNYWQENLMLQNHTLCWICPKIPRNPDEIYEIPRYSEKTRTW